MITVLLQYFQYASLGTQYSLNVELSILDKEKDKEKLGIITGNALIISLFLSLLLLAISVALYFIQPPFLIKYHINNLIIMVFAIGVLNNLCTIFVNIYRSYDDFFEIGFTELTFNLFPFLVIFIFKDLALVKALLYIMLALRVGHIAFYFYRFKYPLSFKFQKKIIQTLSNIGFALMLINIGYNLFFILVRTFVGKNYPVETMGQFTFCFTITNSVVLGVQSFLFTIYSKLIKEFADDTNENQEIMNNINKKSIAYNYTVMLFLMLVISFLPLLFFIFEQYRESYITLLLLLLSQTFFSAGTIHATFVLSKKYHQYMVVRTLFVSTLFAVTIYFLTKMGVDIKLISVCIFFFSFLYAYFQIKSSHQYLEVPFNVFSFIKNNIGYKSFLLILTLFVTSFIVSTNLIVIFAFPIFCLINLKELKQNVQEIKKVLL